MSKILKRKKKKKETPKYSVSFMTVFEILKEKLYKSVNKLKNNQCGFLVSTVSYKKENYTTLLNLKQINFIFYVFGSLS